ncbi:O-antigen ligase family protein [Noviherbaspirillum sedimenti]|uniref:O-antigen ligase family protein n=2 Tax=Noviherbaspirillum sedimenti TaxID=2320865 RepID=A0A3A3G5G7_9BURK|nr:O-antigen ligase family protein [Noviherbaspirillum sedimenti]
MSVPTMHPLAKTLPVLATLVFLTFPVAMGVANALTLLLLLAWIFSGNHRAHWHAIRANPVIMMALLLYGVILLGASYSAAPAADITLHLTKYAKLLFVAVLFSILGDRTWQRRCMVAFTAAMLFILASTWMNLWFVLPWSKTQTPGWGLSHHVFGDYITQNVMMAFFVLWSLVSAKAQKTVARRAAWLAIALLAAVSITHLSDGRSGYLLLATTLLIFVLATLRGKALWAMLIASVLGLGVTLMSSQSLMQRFERAAVEARQSETDNQSSIGHRLYNYRKTPELIMEKPLLGWGTGAYHTQICRIVEKPEWCPVFNWHPHNQYLFLGADHGMLGILAYLALMASMVWLALRDQDISSRTLLLGLAGLLAVNSLVNSPLWSSRESHFFMFMMALLAARSGLALQAEAKSPPA